MAILKTAWRGKCGGDRHSKSGDFLASFGVAIINRDFGLFEGVLHTVETSNKVRN